MRRLDFYVQHMLKQNAQGIVMRSGEVVEFRFTQGKTRRSNQPISHKQVVQLVREVAPPDSSDALRRAGNVRFTTEGQDGNGIIYVLVQALGAELWRVVISIEEISDNDDAGAAPEDGGDEWDGFPQAPSLPGASATAAKRPAPGQASGRPVAPPPAPAAGPPPAPMGPPPAPVAYAGPPAPPVAYAAPVAPVRPKGSAQGEARMQKYLRVMLQLRASDLHLSSGAEPMVRVDGEMAVMEGSQGPLRPEELLDMMMAIAPTDVRRIFDETNDADFAYELDGFGRFRFNYFLDRRGPALVARQIPFDIVTPEHLGLPSSVVDLCWLSKGLVLVTGPTGSGKSTTLASMIDFINRNRADHIITIEDPIEYVHPNKRCLVNQRQVGVHTQSFAQALRAALREDPDIIVVGEMRDLETISIAIETAETGHLVFGTLHTTTASSTVDRIIDQFPSDEQGQIRSMLSESLRGVVSQVLCKKSGGGRVGAYEVLLVNSAAQNLIREGKTFQLKSLMQTARAQGMQTMNDHLFDLVKSHVIDPKEAYIRASDKVGIREAMEKARIRMDPSIFRGQD